MMSTKIDKDIKTKVHIERRVQPLLKGDMLELYERLLAIAVTKALSSGITIKNIHLYVSNDPEENTSIIVFSVSVKAGSTQAIAYWNAIGASIDIWREKITEYMRELLITRWNILVWWL